MMLPPPPLLHMPHCAAEMQRGRQQRGGEGLCVRHTGRTPGQEQQGKCGGGGLHKLSFTTGSLQGLVALVSLTDKPFRCDSSVAVLLACRAALVNHCHSRHVLSASPRPV